MENKGNHSNLMLELVESNIHGYIQSELAELKESAPELEDKKKYFKKNVGAYYKAVNETVNTEQRIKAGGYGNSTVNNLTINLSGLGLNDKKKLLAQMLSEINELGKKLGYDKKETEIIDVNNEICKIRT